MRYSGISFQSRGKAQNVLQALLSFNGRETLAARRRASSLKQDSAISQGSRLPLELSLAAGREGIRPLPPTACHEPKLMSPERPCRLPHTTSSDRLVKGRRRSNECPCFPTSGQGALAFYTLPCSYGLPSRLTPRALGGHQFWLVAGGRRQGANTLAASGERKLKRQP